MPQARHDYRKMPAEELEQFFRRLHPGALAAGRDLVSRRDFSSYRWMLDAGGGSGGLAVAIAEACPHIRATIVDLPTVTPITQQFVNESSARDRLRVLAADVVNEPLVGSYDLAVLKAFTQTLRQMEYAVRSKISTKSLNLGERFISWHTLSTTHDFHRRKRLSSISCS